MKLIKKRQRKESEEKGRKKRKRDGKEKIRMGRMGARENVSLSNRN